MSRVLLFVQTGDARPKSVREHILRYASGDIMWGPKWCTARARADRWWVVECDNAEAGRHLIAMTEIVKAARRYAGVADDAPVAFCGDAPKGRILASGGRS